MNNWNNMNNQGLQQFGNNFQYVQTPEQLAELQRKQQLLMQQQQMYLQEQQRMQKQIMREEQRNRLKNMNVKSMGISTFNQPTVMSSSHHPTPQYPSSHNSIPQSSYHQHTQPYSANNYLIPDQNNSFTGPQLAYNSVPGSVPNKGNQMLNNSFAPVNSSFAPSNVSFNNPGSTFNNPISTPVSNTSFNSSFPSDVLIRDLADDNDDFGDFASTFISPNRPTKPSNNSLQLLALNSDSVNNITPDSVNNITPDSVNNITPDSVNDITPSSVFDEPAPVNPMIPFQSPPTAASTSNSLLVSTESLPPTSASLKHQESFDEFDDFQTASFNDTLPSRNYSSNDYVPGTLQNEDSDVIPSVTIFSNPVKTEPPSSVSEFDSLLMKSLAGKPTKSSVKSLFKPAQKRSIPSVYSAPNPSETAADWSSLSVGDMFQKSQPFDCSIVSSSSLVLEPNSNIFSDSENLVNVTKDQDLICADFDDFVSTPQQQTSTPGVTSTTSDLFSIFSSVPTSTPDLILKPPDLTTTSPKVDQEWCDFSFTPSKASTIPKKSAPAVDVNTLPPLYQDIIKFCDTPSGIIDVGRVYEVMLTDKFKVVAIQPLMTQCNMMESPKVKELVDLIGIVGLKQKGFPTPSKYELDFKNLPIPSVNTKVFRNVKSKTKLDQQPTLLSFVQNDASSVAKKDSPALAPVFDFGFSSSKDLSNAPFAKHSTGPADTNDWGDFGEVVAKVDKKETWSDFEIRSSNKPKSAPQDLLSVQTAVLQITKKVTPPKNFDEPPPLSPLSDDDEDWAEFSHPGSKWDIDLDQIEEESKNNIVTKNRWGSTGTSSSIPEQMKEYIPDKTFNDVNIDISKAPSGNNDLFAEFSSKKTEIPNSDIDSNMSDLFNIGQTSSLKNAEKPARNDDNILADFYSGNSLAKPSSEIVTDVESSKTLHDNADMFAEFTTNASTEAQSNLRILETSAKNNGESLKDKNVGATKPAFDFVDQDVTKFDSPFADFDSNMDDLDDDFSDFMTTEPNKISDNFLSPFADLTACKLEETVDGNIEESTAEPALDPIAESLKLTNLPKKDLDGFWSDMVDSLGPQNPSSNIAPPVVVKKKESERFIPLIQQVSYDALKGESFDNEEDRVGAWSKCLSMVLTILIQCQTVFATTTSPRTKGEVLGSPRGTAYLDSCKAVFKVACRISLSGAADDGIVEIFKEVKHTWSLIAELLDENTGLPTVRDFNIQGNEDSSAGACGICLLGTPSNEADKLRYNGVSYHVTCANLWINTVNPLLPDLTDRATRPSLL